MADEDDALRHAPHPFEFVEEARDTRSRRWPAGGRSSRRVAMRPAIGEGHREAMVVEAVGRGAREAPAAVDRQVVAVDRRRRPPSARRPVGRPGDPVRLLVAQLAGAADRRRARAPAPRPGTGSGSRRSRRRRRPGRGRSPAARSSGPCRSAMRLADAVVRLPSPRPAAPSMSAPIARRRSMTARRVGLTPTPRSVSSASGWIAAGDEPERGRRHVARDPLVDRSHRRPPSRLIHAPPRPSPAAARSRPATPRARSIRSV